MVPVVRNLFQIRSQSFFILTLSPWEFCPAYVRIHYTNVNFSIILNPGSPILFLHHMRNGKSEKLKCLRKIRGVLAFVHEHPSFDFAKSSSELMPPKKFWSICSSYPGLVCRLHVQMRFIGNFGLNTSIPWATATDSIICFICKESEETLHHFLFDCTGFREHFDLLWSSLTILNIYTAPRRMVAICLISL